MNRYFLTVIQLGIIGCVVGNIIKRQDIICSNVELGNALPDPESCLSFYVCLGDKYIKQDCAPGTLFDSVSKICNWPEQVICSDGSTVLPENPDPEVPSNPGNGVLMAACPPDESPENPTHLPHPTDCSKFYKCLEGYGYELDCQEGLEWSIENNWCDYPENAKCVRPLPEAPVNPETPEEPKPEVPSNPGNGVLMEECPPDESPENPTLLPHPTDCSKFYKCLEGYGYELDCQEGLEWSIENNWCDYPENANCVRPLPEAPVNPETPEEPKPEVPSNPGNGVLMEECPPDESPENPTLLPHPTDCSKFYKCLEGYGYELDCQEGLEWSIENNWCDYPENANCVRPLPEAPVNPETPEEPKPEVPSNPGNGVLMEECPPDESPENPTLLPHPTDCSKFYKCLEGYGYELDCQEGLEWSIENNWCDYPENANCVRPLPNF